MTRAFTLIELLVVITIIVVLLALLVPAMDKAIYQAELLQCATQLRAMTSGVIQYAFDNKRRYPDRDIEGTEREGTVTYLPAMALAYPVQGFDSRPPLRPLFSINKMVQCPFNKPVEMDVTLDDINVEASYMMLWGWQYKPVNAAPLRGMFKLGDRFTWRQGNLVGNYNVLASDMDLRYPNSIQTSHPDYDEATLFELVAVEAPGFWPRNNLSRWVNNSNVVRGFIDLNFAYDDGSVEKLVKVEGWARQDERVDRIPLQYDVRRAGDRFHVPSR